MFELLWIIFCNIVISMIMALFVILLFACFWTGRLLLVAAYRITLYENAKAFLEVDNGQCVPDLPERIEVPFEDMNEKNYLLAFVLLSLGCFFSYVVFLLGTRCFLVL